MKKGNNIIIYIGLICFAILCILGACLFHNVVETNESVPFVIEIKKGEAAKVLQPWENGDGVLYVFLPADCSEFSILEGSMTNICIEGIDGIAKIHPEDVLMEREYEAHYDQTGHSKIANIVFMQSANIPALFIDTQSGNMDYILTEKGNAESGSYSIWDSGGEAFAGRIRELAGRGNTSWTGCEKKGFKFLIEDEQALLGLKPSTEWILTANARSNYLSNTIAFWMEDKLGMEHVTHAQFVDLYLNGEYSGNYILCEKITTGSQGIPLNDLDKANEKANPGEKVKGRNQYVAPDNSFKGYMWKHEPSDITGGYLIERDVPEYYADEKCGILLSTGDCYVIHSPKKATVGEAEYLYRYMEELHQAVASADGYSVTGHYYTDYLDIESFALKYVLEEFLNFNDAGRSSAYYYKDSNDVLKAGPGWDFEGAFLGNAHYITLLNGTAYSTELYEQLMQHDDFKAHAVGVFNSKLVPLVQELQEHKMFELRDEIASSARMDMVRWQREDFFNSCQEIASWINERIQFMDEQWNHPEDWISIKFVCDWSANHYFYIHPGESVSQEMIDEINIPQVTQWMDGAGETLQFNKCLYSDTVFYGQSSGMRRSVIGMLTEYAKQVVPELVFGLAFLVVFTVFMVQKNKGRWKK